jgi:hypothetical protein
MKVENQGVYKKRLQINEYDAILYYGADKKNNSEQIAFAFE